MVIKYPNFLDKSDNNIVGVTAVSSGANLEKIDYAINNIKELGFEVKETPNVRKSDKFVSSSGITRAKEFIDLFQDESVGLIISARGGEFLIDMIPYIDEYRNNIVLNTPKWVQGFSDTSLLLYYITTNYNIATIHSKNVNGFAMKSYNTFLDSNIKILLGDFDYNTGICQMSFDMYQDGYIEEKTPTQDYMLNKKVEYKSLNDKDNIKLSGRIIGGTIDTITQLLGTKYDNTINFCNQFEEGMIWYIDNCELNSCEFYRKLIQMKHAGYFKNVNGFLIGRTNVEDTIDEFTLKDAMNKALSDLNVPIIYDVDIGHVSPQMTIINGSYAIFEYNNGKGKLIQKLI